MSIEANEAQLLPKHVIVPGNQLNLILYNPSSLYKLTNGDDGIIRITGTCDSNGMPVSVLELIDAAKVHYAANLALSLPSPVIRMLSIKYTWAVAGAQSRSIAISRFATFIDLPEIITDTDVAEVFRIVYPDDPDLLPLGSIIGITAVLKQSILPALDQLHRAWLFHALRIG